MTKVKNDTIGDDPMRELYACYESADTEMFRTMCLNIIEMSSGKLDTKLKFANSINATKSKQQMLFTTSNYFLAGQGFSV